MRIGEYRPDDLEALGQALNHMLAGVPHCPPASLTEIERSLDGPGCCRAAERLSDARIWLAWDGIEIVGVAHAAIEAATEETPRRGALRCLLYERGQRAAGQALLETAEAHVRDARAQQIIAWHYDHTYRWYHAEHACLSGHLDHVDALLGQSGYAPASSEMVLNWAGYRVTPPAPPLPVSLTWEWNEDTPGGTELVLLAHEGERQVGICVNITHGAFQSAPEAQDWVYTRWLCVEPDLRGHGLGRYLIYTALQAFYERGIRNAAICAMGTNHPARLLYSNAGYCVVDRTAAYSRTLD